MEAPAQPKIPAQIEPAAGAEAQMWAENLNGAPRNVWDVISSILIKIKNCQLNSDITGELQGEFWNQKEDSFERNMKYENL